MPSIPNESPGAGASALATALRVGRSVRMWTVVAAMLIASAAATLITTPQARAGDVNTGAAEWRVAWGTAIDAVSAPSLWTAHPTWAGTSTVPETSYRFIVRPTVSGGAIRLRLSNPTVKWSDTSLVSGYMPVTFVSVTVADSASGAALVPGTTQVVTFGGKRSVTIEPGASVMSDPITRNVAALTDLSVSIYVPSSTVPPSHPQTYVTQYATAPFAGDHTGDPSADAFNQLQEPIYWLDAVDVRTRAPRSIVAIGDSITDGDQGPTYSDDIGMDRHPTWPDFLAQRLAGAAGVPQTAMANVGVNGDSAPGVAARLSHDVLEHPGVTHVVLEIGTNDVSAGQPAQVVIDNITAIVERLHQHRLRVIGATLVPRADFATNNAAQNEVREEVNRFIRTSPIFDGVLDIAAAVGRPDDDNHFQPQYDSGDGLHPNTAGYQAIADSFDLTLLRN